jgi:hypothetical protein
MIAPEYFNNHIAIEGEIIVKRVPNDTGSVLVWNSTTKKISTRTHADIIADLSLMTTNTNQIVTGLKSFITSGGNYAPFNNSLQIYSDDGSNPSMTYSKGGAYVGQTMFDEAGFHFKNGDNNAYYNVRAKGFIKDGYNNDFILLAGGGQIPSSEFVLASTVPSTLGFYHKRDSTGALNNASDTHTNQTWFDYNYAGTGYLGSVANFSGLNNPYSTELFASYNNPHRIAIRSRNGDSNTWNEPNWLWHDKNLNKDEFVASKIIDGSYNANNLSTNSITYGYSVVNAPTSVSSHSFTILNLDTADSNYKMQLGFDSDANEMFSRIKSAGNWSDWDRIISESWNNKNNVHAVNGDEGNSINTFDSLNGRTQLGSIYDSNWWHAINIQHRNGLDDGAIWGGQIRFGMTGELSKFQFRQLYNGTYNDWKEIYHSGNLNVENYIPYTGANQNPDFNGKNMGGINRLTTNGSIKHNGLGLSLVNISGSGGYSSVLIKTGMVSGNMGTFTVKLYRYAHEYFEFNVNNYKYNNSNYATNITWKAGNSKAITRIEFLKDSNNVLYVNIVMDMAYPRLAITDLMAYGWDDLPFDSFNWGAEWNGDTSTLINEGQALPANFLRDSYLDDVYLSSIQPYWKRFDFGSFSAIKTDKAFGILAEAGNAQKLLTNGLYIGENYNDQGLIPTNGIYSTGSINTAGYFLGRGLFYSGLSGSGQIIQGAGSSINIGNESLTSIRIETGDVDLTHYREGYGNKIIWDGHNFNPSNYVDKTSNENIGGTKKFTGYNTQWLRDNNPNWALGFVNSLSDGFAIGTVNDKDVYFYRNDFLKATINNNGLSVGGTITSALGFYLQGFDNNYMLLAGGSYKALSDFALASSLNNYIPTSQKAQPNGVATLDGSGLVPATQLPSYVDDVLEFANLASFPSTGETGKIYVATDTNQTYRWSGSTYIQIASGAVQSVNGQTGVVNLTKSDIGLGNVDNTADVIKNVATAGSLRNVNITLAQLNSFNLEPGIYNAEGYNPGQGLTSDYHYIIQLGSYTGGGYRAQIAIPYTAGANDSMYIRTAVGGTWSTWERTAKSSELTTAITDLDNKTFKNNADNTLKTINASNYNDVVDGNGKIWLGNFYALPESTTGFQNSIGTILNINGLVAHDKTQLIFNGNNGNIQYRTSWYANTPWSTVRTLWDNNNLPNPANQTWVSQNYIPKTHPAYGITQDYLSGWFTYKGYGDVRTIAPSNIEVTKLQFGFTSWNNDGGVIPVWGDYLHFGGYPDSSGGSQNLITFKKNGFGMRQWQGSSQGVSPYQSYVDYWNTGNFTQANIDNWNTAFNNQGNYVTINTPQHNITGEKTFNSGLALNSGQSVFLTTYSDQAHYIRHFINDDTDGFGVSSAFVVKPYDNAGINWFKADGSGTKTVGKSIADEGFQNTGYLVDSRNRIWSFANSDNHGISYFQGGYNPIGEGISFHFGNSSDYMFFVKNNGQLYSKVHGDSSQWYDAYYNMLPNQNWSGSNAVNTRRTVGELAWKAYGNGHTIFDISNGVSPWGVTKSITDAEVQWSPTYPTLVGGNGANTYGVRVDSARTADHLGNIAAGSYVTQSNLNSQLGNYATLNGVQTFTSTNTFSQSPIVPNGTLGTHAVNKNQIELSVAPESEGGQQLNISGNNSVHLTNNFVTSRDGSRNPDDIAPNSTPRRVRFDFANSTSAGLGGSGNYAGIMTYSPWDGTSASTGDSSYQLAFANQSGINGSGIPMLKIRKGIDGKWSKSWYKFWTDADFSITNINQWNYAYQYGLRLNEEFTTNTGSGLILVDDYYGGDSGMIDHTYERFVAGKLNNYYKYGSYYAGWDGLNYNFERKLFGMGREANDNDKLTIEGSVKASGNFKSEEERPDTLFIPNGNVAALRDEIINDESDYAIRLDPHEYEIDPSGYLEIDDRNRLIHIIGEQTKMVVNFKEIYPKQQIVIYNFDTNGYIMEVQIHGKPIYHIEAGCFLRLYVTKSLRVIAERQQPSEIIY